MTNLTPSFWLDLAQWAITIIVAIAVWVRKPGEGAVQQIEELQREVHAELAQVRGDYIRLEEQVRHLPTEREFRELSGQIGAQTEALNGLKVEMARITNWLMNNK